LFCLSSRPGGMAIRHGDQVVFYHPLDSYVESISSAPWDGVARFVSGQVGFALGGSAPTLAFGDETAFSSISVVSSPPEMVALGGGRVVLAYIAEANSAWVRVGQSNGLTVSWGVPSQLAAGWSSSVALAMLESGKIAVSLHRMGEVESDVWVATVSGTDLTLGSPAQVPGQVESLGAMSADTLVACSVDPDGGWAFVGSVSGLTASFGIGSKFADDPLATDFLPLSQTVAVIFCEDVSTNLQTARRGELSGSPQSFQWGPPSVLASGQGQPCFSSARLASASFALCYCDTEGAKARAGSATATVSFGAPTDLLPGPASVSAVSSSQVAIVYRTPSPTGDKGTSLVADIVGQSLLPGAITQFSAVSGSMWHPGVSASGNEAFIAYREGNDGKARVGGVTRLAAEMFGDGTLHPSASGETKLVFAAWLRKPS